MDLQRAADYFVLGCWSGALLALFAAPDGCDPQLVDVHVHFQAHLWATSVVLQKQRNPEQLLVDHLDLGFVELVESGSLEVLFVVEHRVDHL